MFPVECGALVDALYHVAALAALVGPGVRAEAGLPVRVLLVQQRETWKIEVGKVGGRLELDHHLITWYWVPGNGLVMFA